MNETISVIVPVYNVAAYLPQCLESILNQDYGDLQVLLIDDGSTDDSGAICDQFAAQDSRIQVIHQKNSGAASAKNAGLRAASGKYLSFVDSDDYLEPGVYGFLVKTLEEARADAVQGAFQEVYQSRTEVRPLKPETLEGFDYLLRFPKDFTCALLWNKLYRRELFNGVFFEEGHKIDDEYFTYQGFLQPRKVVCTDRVIYNYRKRASSVMGLPGSCRAADSGRPGQRCQAAAESLYAGSRPFPGLRRELPGCPLVPVRQHREHRKKSGSLKIRPAGIPLPLRKPVPAPISLEGSSPPAHHPNGMPSLRTACPAARALILGITFPDGGIFCELAKNACNHGLFWYTRIRNLTK